MALRAVFDRTPREAPKFLPLRGLRGPHLLLCVEQLDCLLDCGPGEAPDVGRRERRPSTATGRGRSRWFGCGLTAALGVLRASAFICVKTLLVLPRNKGGRAGRDRAQPPRAAAGAGLNRSESLCRGAGLPAGSDSVRMGQIGGFQLGPQNRPMRVQSYGGVY
jgi:hypothetical protein